jgi:hypothetical protein
MILLVSMSMIAPLGFLQGGTPVLPPAIDDVGRRADRDQFGFAVLEADAVQVAAVLRHQLGDERRLPYRLERVRHAQRRQAGIRCVGKDDAARRLDAEFVHIDVAGHLGVARHIQAVEPVVGELVWLQRVLQPPHLLSQPQRTRRGFM